MKMFKNTRLWLGILGLLLVAGGSYLLHDPFLVADLVNTQVVEAPAVSSSKQPDDSVRDNTAAPGGQQLPQKSVKSVGRPVKLMVPSVGINIAVANGYYNATSKQWTLSMNKAHFAVMTATPNTSSGNTFIYGHNRSSVFARLTKIQPGSTAIVKTDDHKQFTYRLRLSHTTQPEDSTTLFYDGPPILTLQTCTGTFFQNRTLYVFDLVGETHA